MTDISMGADLDPAGAVPADSPAATAKATNEYDTLLAQAVVPAPAASVKNEYDALVVDLDKERNQRVRATIMGAQQSTPDVAAKALTLSQKTGVPPDVVERNLPKVEADQKLNEYDAIIQKSPKLSSWLLADQINARVAKDDFESLSFLEHTANELFWRPYYSGRVEGQEKRINQAVQLGADLEAALSRKAAGEPLSAYDEGLLKDEASIRDVVRETIMDAGTERSRRQQQAAALPQRPNVIEMQKAGKEGDWEGWWQAFIKDPLGAFYSTSLQALYTLPAQMVAGAIAGPYGAGAVSFGAEYWGALMDALEEGGVDINDPTQLTQAFANPEKMAKVKQQATIKAGTIATLDAGSFAVASKFLGVGRRMVTRTATNIPAQIALQGALGGAGEAGGSYLAGLKVDPHAVMAEIMGEGFGAPVEVATANWRAARQADMTASQWEQFQTLPPLEQQATGMAMSIDKMVAIANDTKLAATAPSKLQEFIASVSGQDATVYVPADIVMSYMQDMTGLQAEQFAERLGITDQLKRIAATNEDVAIPLARYVTGASEAHKAWREQIRTEVDGFSIAQAQEFEKAKATELKELQARFEEQIQAGVVADPATVVYQQVMAMLKANGYTNEVAAQHAALYAARYETRAARNPGRYADALDAFQQAGPGTGMTIQTVLPDGTRALGPDVFDAILNSIRSGKDPIVPPAHFAHLEARKEAQKAALEPVLGPEPAPPPPTPKQVSEARQKAAMEAFKAQRQEVADALASMGLDPATMTNEQIRQAVTKQVEGRTLQQSGVEILTNGMTVKGTGPGGRITILDVGKALTADHKKKHKKQFFPESKPADYATVLKYAADEMRVQLGRDNSGVGWYGADVALAVDLTGQVFPTLATDTTHRQLYLTFAGLFSSGLDPDQAWMVSADAFRYFLETGEIPVERVNPDGTPVKMTTFKDKKGNEVTQPAGWGPRNQGNKQQLALLKFLVEREGGVQQALDWLFATHPKTEINALMTESGLYKEVRFTTKKQQEGETYGFLVFGEKLGRYALGLQGVEITADDTTVDLWYTRTFRRWTGRLLEAPIGNEGVAAQPANDLERSTIFRLTDDLAKEFGLSPGDVQAVLWFFEKRLWGALGIKTNEGTNSSGARKLLRSLGIDDGTSGDGSGQQGGQADAGASGGRGGRGRKAAAGGTGQAGVGKTYQQSVWHGSPHIYDKFSLGHIGSGEGAQAFGWGLYFASSKALGQYYRESLTTRDRAMMIKGATPAQKAALQAVGWNYSHSDLTTLDEITPEVLGVWADDYLEGTGDEQVAEAIRTLPVDKIERPKGRLYEVEIPDDGAYLLWDKGLNEQPKPVRDALPELIKRYGGELSKLIGANGQFRNAVTGEMVYRALSRALGDSSPNDKAASLALREAGIPGIKYLDGQSRNKGDGSYNYVLFDDSLAQIKSYEQEARGEITFADNITTISLFQARDLSTLAHETGHLWLAELEADAKHSAASDQVKADWQTVLKFLGSDGYITREQHELFARAFETYLMEGKAPSEGLRSVFRSFKNWLVSIYRNLLRLQAPISPEMREVFDRLVATDEEIASAQNAQGFNPVFTDAKSAGMTEAEFAAYTKRVTQVVDEAEQAVLEKVMASIRRQKTKEVAAEKAKIRGEVTAEMMKDPGNAALHLLRTGMLYGTPVTPMSLVDAKLDRAALVALIGEEGLQSLPAGIYKAEGINPDDLAQVFGLGNGQELVERLMQIRAEQDAMRAKGDNRSVLNARIAEETQRRLTEALGDPLNDGSIEAEAMAAVHSDKQGALLSSELKVLARKAGHSGTITLADIETWAANTIGEMSVYQATQANKFLRAERMAGQAVQRALIKGDFAAAFKAKQDQLVNFALYREAKKAAQDAESVRKLADRYASADTIKSMDQGALDQIHQILEEFDFKRRSGSLLAERTTWSAWAAEQAAQGFEVIEPPRLKGADKKHFSQMTMEEIRGLGDTIKQIAHIGRWKQEMIDGAKKRAFEEIVAEAVETAGKIDQRGVSQLRRGTTNLQDMLGDVGSWFRSVDAALLKMETLFEWLDNDKTGRGVFSRVVFRRVADAQVKERDMQKDLSARMAAIYDKVPAEQRKQWSKQYTIAELGQRLNKSQLIAVALNTGNASNLQKMLQGEQWSEAAVRDVLNKYLTKEEWQFVQDTWDLIDSLWPQTEALEKRINGVAPPKVEATPVETPYGTLKGGYYPMAYDKAGDIKADRIAAKSAEGLFDPEYRRASVRAGSTNKRVEGFNAKVLLSLNVIGQHLTEVAHDLAYREVVMDAFKFLSDDRVREAIRSAVGPEYEKQTQVWLKAVANEWAIDRRGLEGIDKFLQTARANTAIVGMGFRVSTMLSQVAGFANSAQRLGLANMLRGMRDFYKDPAGMAAFVRERSGEMRHRANDLERDIRLALKRMEGKDGSLDAVRRFAFRGIALFDAAVSLPTWVGAYNEGLRQGMTDAEAVAYGDKMVRDTQGAGSVKDLSAFQRGGEALKLFGMFYSYFNVYYNRQRGIVRDARSADSFSDYMDVVAQGFWLMVAPTLLAALLSGQGPEDDEEWWAWAVRNVGFGAFSGIPLGRDVANAASNQIAGKGFGGAKLSPIEGIGEGMLRLGKDVIHLVKGEETSRTSIKNLFNVVGLFTALPTGQAGASTQFIWDALVEGTQNPEGLLDWMKGLVYGPKKDK